ncbi:MAG: SurA N-terminal domain-containing protein [Elusimicrobia bacterium]|nr:SurA N-terminal domain-containing protein [Elusimicrobiota bacterium]
MNRFNYMMEFIREHKKTIFWITLIGFLFATFAYFGAGGSLVSGQDTVATVNSKKVSYSEYIKAVSRAIDNARQDKKDTELTDAEIQQIKRNTLQDMISEEAFYQLALKYGIKVTDGELKAHLQQIPAFQKDGHFDHRKYYQILAYGLKMTPSEFEESRKRAIAVDKVRFLIYLLSKVSEKEAELEYLRRNGNLKNWSKEKNEFIMTLQSEKRVQLFQQWITQLQQKVKIKDYLGKFENVQSR